MVLPHRTAHKSTRRQYASQMAPRDVPPQPELQPNSPQYVPQEEDPFEIMVMVPAGEEAQEVTEESQQLPHNEGNNNNHDNDNDHEEEEEDHEAEEEEEEVNEDEDNDDEDYTPLSDSKKEKMYHDADEIKTTINEALMPTGRLRDLLNCIDTTTPPEFRIKRVSCPRQEEYKAIVEIFNNPSVVSHTRVQLSEPLTRMQYLMLHGRQLSSTTTHIMTS
jgi:hypothetical protein